MADNSRFYEGTAGGAKRSAPAALRNRGPIADVLADWLPASGLVLEIASGTGEHIVHFADRFRQLDWQPSDTHAVALRSIAAWQSECRLTNIREPIPLDVTRPWPIDRADALLNINMVHISPWAASLALLDGAMRILPCGAPLILYGPWLSDEIETAESNKAFDSQLKSIDQAWGIRRVEDFAAAAEARGLSLEERRFMPANNMMLLFRRSQA